MPELEPYENTLSIDELRRELRECWDRERAIADALSDLPEMAPPWILLFFDRAAKFPDDHNIGKQLQRKLGSEVIPIKTECEGGAGIWFRIRQGMMMPRPDLAQTCDCNPLDDSKAMRAADVLRIFAPLPVDEAAALREFLD